MKAKKLFAGILISSILLSTASGCAKKTKTKSGLATIDKDNGNDAIFELVSGKSAKSKSDDEDLKKAYSEFVLGLAKRCAEESGKENFLISSDSVLFALEMTAAGADGDTLDQMLDTLMPGADKEDAFLFAVDRMAQLRSNQLSLANSVWINEKEKAAFYSNYLKYVEDNFDAKIDSVPFDDTGVDKINSWVNDNTAGMIPTLIDKLSTDDVMVLVNALAFDAKWKKAFEPEDVEDGTFLSGDGTREDCKYLCGENDVVYLSNDTATGFYKRYEGEKYAFMVILPGAPEPDFLSFDDLENNNSRSKSDETDWTMVDINRYVSLMTAEDYWNFWNSRNYDDEVEYMFPEFTSEYSTSLKDILHDMGMEDAFNSSANFENMSDLKPLFIGDVIHKTKIEVNATGTKAAASTGVIMEHNSVIMQRKVICNRPFAYAIVDVETGLPIFFGTVEHVNE
ncbi:MAG: serpin family protein [Clostridiales bacterium]|nr:serpin family protein [Clostridiales bacterium]